jgi:hypothetical protein
MTDEQKKVIKRCIDMLKAVFPQFTGHVKFDMCEGKRTQVSVCHVNLKVEE